MKLFLMFLLSQIFMFTMGINMTNKIKQKIKNKFFLFETKMCFLLIYWIISINIIYAGQQLFFIFIAISICFLNSFLLYITLMSIFDFINNMYKKVFF